MPDSCCALSALIGWERALLLESCLRQITQEAGLLRINAAGRAVVRGDGTTMATVEVHTSLSRLLH